MKNYICRLFICSLLICITAITLSMFDRASMAKSLPSKVAQMATPTFTPPPRQHIFNFPVVYRSRAGTDPPISSYFDHQGPPFNNNIVFYNGVASHDIYGFFCSYVEPQWFSVGCTEPTSAPECPAGSTEMWYDGHKGMDFEYFGQWHSGNECLSEEAFEYGQTEFAVYAPASGKVTQIDRKDLGPNGAFVRIEHDVDGDGSYRDDNIRSVYLHFAEDDTDEQFYGINKDLKVNDLIEEGDFIGYGASTGSSWTPHLHFEVQRAHIDFSSSNGAFHWSVDPFGWEGNTNDPWLYANVDLWDYADGDLSCDGTTNAIDALFILQYDIGQKASQYTACPLQTLPSNPDLRFVHIACFRQRNLWA